MTIYGAVGTCKGLCVVELKSAQGRWLLGATVLASALAFIDATIVNVAVPAIGQTFHAGLASLTWVVNGYTLSLSAFLLLGGALGDRFGRRRIFVIGIAWFAVASLACGLAPSMTLLVSARVLQGVGGALLTPGSLALIQASLREEDRGRAIGAWSALGGVAGAAGPFLGGWLLQVASWRWAMLVNVPLGAAVIFITLRFVPESRNEDAPPGLDLVGAVATALGLAGLTDGLIRAQDHGLGAPGSFGPFAIGAALLVAFVFLEHRSRAPMMPLSLFASRTFSVINAITFVVYGALGAIIFWLVLELQITSGFRPLAAGTAILPVTVVMLLLSSRAGELSQRVGPKLPMTVGLALGAAGAFALSGVGAGTRYLTGVLPGVGLLGLGLSATVAPLTTTVLAAAPGQHAGVASAINNAVARVAGLLAVAAFPLVLGLHGEAYHVASRLEPAYRHALDLCAGLLAAGAVLSALLVPAGRAVTPSSPRPPASPGARA